MAPSHAHSLHTRSLFSEAKTAVACKKQPVMMVEARESEDLEQESTSSHVPSILDGCTCATLFGCFEFLSAGVISLLTNSHSVIDRTRHCRTIYIETSQYYVAIQWSLTCMYLKLCSVCLDLCMCSTFIIGSLQHKIGIIGCISRNNRDIS